MDSIIIDGIAFTLPLFIIAIGGIYSERSGIVNLALEGLLGVGAFSGALAAILLKDHLAPNSPWIFIVALLCSMLGAALYASLHALLCIRFRANQVISGVVINILAAALTAFLTSQLNKLLFDQPSDKFILGSLPRWDLPVLSKIPILGAAFSRIYPFVPIMIVLAIIAWYVLYHSRFGMHLRAAGDNPHALAAAGISVSKVRFLAVIISGALSGIGGIAFAYSISAQFSPSIYVGFGYLSIAALIFGNWRIPQTLFACVIFGFARSGGYELVRQLGLPAAYSDLILILPYVLTLFLLLFFSSSNRAPRALGIIYDKGAR